MKKRILSGVFCIIIMAVFVIVFNLLTPHEEKVNRIVDHLENEDVDVNIGSTSVPSDGKITSSFESHLPIVVIDKNGKTLPNIYMFTNDGMGRTYTKAGKKNPNPYISVDFSIINNLTHINRLLDKAEFSNKSLMKLRGMSSRYYEKKQYGIKLMDGDEELEASLLSMDADEDWVLSNSLIDPSYLRNYTALNIGGEIMPFTPDVRFCELVFKDGKDYEYEGLYLLTEKVKKGDGHIEVEDYNKKFPTESYVVCRDRYDETEKTLSTYAEEEGLCYGTISMVYPKSEQLSDSEMSAIEDDISSIEKIIYSDDPEVFSTYANYIDVDSFVDYFIINEFFMNYDAGDNSTYYYKNQNGKLAIGPLWDFDMCAGNDPNNTPNFEYAVFAKKPWYDKLLRDPTFEKRIISRYQELRKGILSDSYIKEFIEGADDYLGNAKKREVSRWAEAFTENHSLSIEKDEDDILIDRNRSSHEAYVEEFEDVLLMHAKWMDEGLDRQLSKMEWKKLSDLKNKNYTWLGLTLILIFISISVIAVRVAKGEYR